MGFLFKDKDFDPYTAKLFMSKLLAKAYARAARKRGYDTTWTEYSNWLSLGGKYEVSISKTEAAK